MNIQEKRYWFKNKEIGFGWRPVTWEGWVTVVAYACAMVGWAFLVFSKGETTEYLVIFFVGVFLLVGLLLAICVKTGETLEYKIWRSREDIK